MDHPHRMPTRFDAKCPFCQIAAGERSATVIKRWPRFLAFTPKRPATAGHTLIVPVDHISTIWNLPVGLAEELLVHATSLASAMRATLNLDGLNLIQSNGEAATQTVPHLHLHLVPRYKQDAMGTIWPDGEPTDAAESELASTRLRAAMEKQDLEQSQ